jgi:hypothetical protein
MAIPDFRPDGYLPEGVYECTEAEALFRFGAGGRTRRRLAMRLRRWCELAREVHANRLLVDGSFITAKLEPGDVDAVLLLPADFQRLVDNGLPAAVELEEMMFTRQPAELFGVEDESDWQRWIEFFSRTREAGGRRKGLVELRL